MFQEKVQEIPDLEEKIDTMASMLSTGIDILKKAMIQNVVYLDFNKDLCNMISQFTLDNWIPQVKSEQEIYRYQGQQKVLR